jgi:hypothetical protein
MGPIGCPETSVNNSRHSLRSNPGERDSHLLRGGSLKITRDRSGPRPGRFTPGKLAWYPSGVPQSQTGRYGVNKNPFAPTSRLHSVEMFGELNNI